jgi:hypothetical protein
MSEGKFVSYLCVSTARQGRAGLGLEAQRKAVTDFLNGGNWTLVREFVEVESGKRRTALSWRRPSRRAASLGQSSSLRSSTGCPEMRMVGRSSSSKRGGEPSSPTIKELEEAGYTSLRAIAAGLEARGVPAARGGKWSSVQVMRVAQFVEVRPLCCAMSS